MKRHLVLRLIGTQILLICNTLMKMKSCTTLKTKHSIIIQYSLEQKDGYTFPSENEISVTINGEKISSEYYDIYDSNIFGVSNFKDIRLAQISKVEIGGTTLSYQVGDTPKATSFKNYDNYYDYNIEYEYWEEMQSKDDGSVVPVAYWYSDEEKNNALLMIKR